MTGSPKLVKQDLLKLFRRSQVERSAGEFMRLFLHLLHGRRELAALFFQHRLVEQDTVFLHSEQNRNQRLLNIRVHLCKRRGFLQFGMQMFVQPQRDVRIFGGVRRCLLQVNLVEGQLFCAFAGNIFIVDRLDTQVVARRGVHVVPGGHAVENVRFQHGVEADAAQADAITRENMRIVFQVMPDFVFARVFEKRFQCRKHIVAVELVRAPG